MKYGSKTNLSTKSCSDFSELLENLKLDSQNAKGNSKRKISEVAKKLPSNLSKALSYFHQQNNNKGIKANENKTSVFVVALK